MHKLRCLVIVLFALGIPAADACSVSLPWQPFVNLVRMTGPRIPGLHWTRIYNVLDYEGDQRVQVSVLRHGERIPVVRWENGQECLMHEGGESCQPNSPQEGAGFEAYFPNWRDAGPTAASLQRVYLRLIVEVDGREFRPVLSSHPVRNTRKLQLERTGRYNVCPDIDLEQG